VTTFSSLYREEKKLDIKIYKIKIEIIISNILSQKKGGRRFILPPIIKN
jgi:hypothetical protein|tara:strand:- start:239 stop:385 length:147 start_codon:yes stop_codon:yes gene_type:complete